MKTMRDAFGESLIELAKIRDDFVVLDADVAGGTGTNVFRDAFPDRFIQCAIAEQNMMSAAAGLSTTGIIPIVTCYGVFASMRAVEQARNSIAYPKFNVKIVASHLGLDVGPDGPTHQAIEDMAIFRAIPNFTVISPADPAELKAAMSAVLDYDGPVYFRTGRSPVPDIFASESVESNENSAIMNLDNKCSGKNNNSLYPFRGFEIGRGTILEDGNDLTIIAIGVMVHRALKAAQILAQESISCRVVNMSTIKPIDKDLIIDSAKKTGAIVTAEDHNIIGGLGSAVAEIVVENYPVPMFRVGIRDQFAESGDPLDLAAKYHLTAQDIADASKKLLENRAG